LTRIVNNKLLYQSDSTDTLKSIRNWNTTFMTTDGPNSTTMKIGLEDFGIPYDTHYRSRVVLSAGFENYPLHYGLLENVTFLLIKVTYNGNCDFPMEDDFDPNYRYEKETYNINYYYESNSGITYPIGRLLLLNGSFSTPLEKIYLNNPLDYDVVLDILHANINPPKSSISSSAITISNLYWNDIITDQVICSGNTGYTGSTMFIISEFIPVIPTGFTINEYYIPYDTILSFHKDANYPIIILYTTNYTIYLNFLTQFDCDQSYSRMMFAITEYPTCRYLTYSNIYESNSALTSGSTSGTDNISPVIYYNKSIHWNGSGTTIPTNIFISLSGTNVLTISDLEMLFISGITDNWDGNIALSSIIFDLYESGYPSTLTGITHDGIYNIIVSVTDNAGNNITNYIANICVDDTSPVIVYQYGVLSPSFTGDTTIFSGASSAITSGIIVTSGFSFNLTGFTPVYIGRMEIIENIVDNVYDLIDIDINKYMLNILIAGLDGAQESMIIYSGVTSPGYYLVKLSISDKNGNEVIDYLIMNMNYIESCFSYGYWKDERVWIDETYWKDHVSE